MVVTRESKNIKAATSNGRNSLKQMKRGSFYVNGRKEVNPAVTYAAFQHQGTLCSFETLLFSGLPMMI